MKQVILILIFNLILIKLIGQKLPIDEFVNIYFNPDKFSFEHFQSDTTTKSKKEFLNRLKFFDKKSYGQLEEFMQFNDHDFPQQFYITDIDENGINEYFIREDYEGTYNLCYTFKDGKVIKFLEYNPFQIMLIDNPAEIWLVAHESYVGWDRSMELLDLQNDVYLFNIQTTEPKLMFHLYEASQMPIFKSDLPYLNLNKPINIYEPKPILTNNVSKFYSDYRLIDNYINLGKINACSYGWALADTLNSVFVIFDSNTGYVNDSLGLEKLSVKDKGYMLCWISKDVIDFVNENTINGLFYDDSTKENIRIVYTNKGLSVNYFSDNSFERSLIIDKFDQDLNKIIVRFKNSKDKYILSFNDNFKYIECLNPNGKKQIFKRIE